MLSIGSNLRGISWPMSKNQDAALCRWREMLKSGELRPEFQKMAVEHARIIGEVTGTKMSWNWETFSLAFPLDGSASSVWYDFAHRAWTDHNPTASKTVAALSFLCWLVNVYLDEALVSKLGVT